MTDIDINGAYFEQIRAIAVQTAANLNSGNNVSISIILSEAKAIEKYIRNGA